MLIEMIKTVVKLNLIVALMLTQCLPIHASPMKVQYSQGQTVFQTKLQTLEKGQELSQAAAKSTTAKNDLKHCLEEVQLYNEFLQSHPADPEILTALSAAQQFAAESQLKLRGTSKARALFEQSVSSASQALTLEPNNSRAMGQKAFAQAELAYVKLSKSQNVKALNELQSALELIGQAMIQERASEILPSLNGRIVHWWVLANKDVSEIQKNELLQPAIDKLQRISDSSPEKVTPKLERNFLILDQATLLESLGNLDKSLAKLDFVADSYTKILDSGVELSVKQRISVTNSLAVALLRSGKLLTRQQKFDGARLTFKNVIEIGEATLKMDPKNSLAKKCQNSARACISKLGTSKQHMAVF
jgi:tetratricopeptide (TPR) repeat protein